MRSAVERTESRGNHFRSDYPETQRDWERKNIVAYLNGEGGISVSVVERRDTPDERGTNA